MRDNGCEISFSFCFQNIQRHFKLKIGIYLARPNVELVIDKTKIHGQSSSLALRDHSQLGQKGTFDLKGLVADFGVFMGLQFGQERDFLFVPHFQHFIDEHQSALQVLGMLEQWVKNTLQVGWESVFCHDIWFLNGSEHLHFEVHLLINFGKFRQELVVQERKVFHVFVRSAKDGHLLYGFQKTKGFHHP